MQTNLRILHPHHQIVDYADVDQFIGLITNDAEVVGGVDEELGLGHVRFLPEFALKQWMLS